MFPEKEDMDLDKIVKLDLNHRDPVPDPCDRIQRFIFGVIVRDWRKGNSSSAYGSATYNVLSFLSIKSIPFSIFLFDQNIFNGSAL